MTGSIRRARSCTKIYTVTSTCRIVQIGILAYGSVPDPIQFESPELKGKQMKKGSSKARHLRKTHHRRPGGGRKEPLPQASLRVPLDDPDAVNRVKRHLSTF